MAYHRIAVGFDGSPAAGFALDFAIQQALVHQTSVAVVTAWPDDTRTAARAAGTLVSCRQRLQRMQMAAIAQCVVDLPTRPPITREIILADPVTALCYQASRADLIVVGRGAPGTDHCESVGGLLEARLAGLRRPGVVTTAIAVVEPATARRPATHSLSAAA